MQKPTDEQEPIETGRAKQGREPLNPEDYYESAVRAMVVDIIDLALGDYRNLKRGGDTSKAHVVNATLLGFDTPLQEIEAFWEPSERCRLYLDCVDINVELTCARIRTEEFLDSEPLFARKLSVGGTPRPRNKRSQGK